MAETPKPVVKPTAPKATEPEAIASEDQNKKVDAGTSVRDAFVAPNPMVNKAVVETSSGVVPDAGHDDLLAAALVRAPHLTAEFLDKYDLDDEYLEAVANGQEPPPPYIPDVPGAQTLTRTPGGWQITAPGVPAKDANKNAITRL